ncbi:MAG: hypothetical protein L6461_01305 [Anaerolineae bacterium]|nr:hypothetical protein [Anaerolineae bacterium]
MFTFIFVSLIAGVGASYLLFSWHKSEKSYGNTGAVASVAVLYGIVLLFTRISLNLWADEVQIVVLIFSFLSYGLSYYFFYMDFRRIYPQISIDFFSYLGALAKAKKTISSKEIGAEAYVTDFATDVIRETLRTKPLYDNDTHVEGTTASFFTWGLWIIHLLFYVGASVGIMNVTDIGVFFQSWWSEMSGEFALYAVFIVVILVIWAAITIHEKTNKK